MKKYGIECWSSRVQIEAKVSDEIKELINILVDFGESIDPQGYGDGKFDKAINAIIKLFKKR